MNTLSKKITPFFFTEETRNDCYNEVRKHWLALQRDPEKTLTLAHHILYAILRGKDWRKTFTPVTSEIKLANGAQSDRALHEALFCLNARMGVYEDFAPLIDPQSCAIMVRAILQGRRASAYNAAALEEFLKEKLAV